MPCIYIDFLIGFCRKSIIYTLWNFLLLSMLRALIQIGFQMSYVVSVTVFPFCDLNTVHLLNFIYRVTFFGYAAFNIFVFSHLFLVSFSPVDIIVVHFIYTPLHTCCI